ncbi:hypothetical protein MMC12_006125 [Toensbergia leucococca]|nr:hypothetical protein [Toensbergia leucococca]
MPPKTDSPEVISINLTRVLTRLEQKILITPSPLLNHNPYERTKTLANVEYARTLLLSLEHSTSTLKIQSRKQAAQSALQHQRSLIKRLTTRLQELDQLDDGTYSDASEEEDLLGDINPTTQEPTPTPTSPSLDRRKEEHPTSTTSTLRNRHKNPAAPTPSTLTLLVNDSAQQAHLTTNILTLAQQLKANQLALAKGIEADKEVVSRATEGLDRNVGGMEAAGKRMGMLRRMSEGKGWWGRMMLYAWIAGLWLVAISIMVLMPKLRF